MWWCTKIDKYEVWTGFFFFPPISTPQVDVREPSDGQWGAQMENGSWSGVVEMTNSSNTFVDL